MRKEHRDLVREWESVRDHAVEGGFFQKESRAIAYVNERLAKVWRPWLGFNVEDDQLSEELGLTSTTCMVLHLFGRGVLHFGCERTRAPEFPRDKYVPFLDENGVLRRPRAICRRDISKLIGRSISAIDSSIAGLRGKGKHEQIYSKRLAFALYVDSGIMLDVLTNAQTLLTFEVDDYTYAKRLATNCRLRDAETNWKQTQWSDERADPDAINRIRMAVTKDDVPARQTVVH